MKCLLIVFAVSVLFACDAKKTVVQDVLDRAKRGEDTSEYWVGGVVKQKLYNVIEYKIVSDRPLKETIREYVPKAMEYFDQSIEFSEKKIAEAEKKSEQLQELLPSLERMANAPVPYQYYFKTKGQDTLGNYSRMVEALMSYQQQFPEADMREVKNNVDKAKPLIEKANDYKGRDRTFTSRSLQKADRYIDMAYTKFSDIVSNNRKRYDSAVQEMDAEPENINREENNIAELQKSKAKFEDFVSKANGVAYNVNINSLNKAGEPIVAIWTITVIELNKKWKVSHIYNEEVFDLEKAPILMVGALLSIVGCYDAELEKNIKLAKSKLELERKELARQKSVRDNPPPVTFQPSVYQNYPEPRQPRRVKKRVYGPCSCCYGKGTKPVSYARVGPPPPCQCCGGSGLRIESRWVDEW